MIIFRAQYQKHLAVHRQELSGTPNPRYFLKSIASTNGRRIAGTNRRCIAGTNWRCIAVFPFLQSLEASKAQRYKWEAYCGTNWRSTASTSQTSCTGWGFLNSADQGIVFENYIFILWFSWFPRNLGICNILKKAVSKCHFYGFRGSRG